MAKDNNKEDKLPIVFSPGEVLGDVVFEQREGGKYVIFDLKAKKFVMSNEGGECWQTPHETFFPLNKVPWPQCTLPALTIDYDGLWGEIKQFIYQHADLPDPFLYDVLTAWVFATWVREKLRVVPYIFAYGPLASGKTWLLEVLQKISFRGALGSNVSAAALYRGIEKFHPTIFLDETEIYSVAEKSEIIGLLNSGYRKGQFAWRVKNTDQGSEIEFFDVFGFKALAGTEQLKNTLESRSIIIRMMKNRRKIPLHIDEEKALDIRNKLLTWRFHKLSDGSDGSDGYLGDTLPYHNQRINEIMECLLFVANSGRQNILKYAEKLDEEWQNREETSIEAEVLENIISCEGKVENGLFLTKDVAEKFNSTRKEKEQWKTNSVGRIISRLGFMQKRASNGTRGWRWDEDYIKHNAERYGITQKKLSELSDPSVVKLENVFYVSCELCGKPIHEGDSVATDPSSHKPVHLECYSKFKEGQKNAE